MTTPAPTGTLPTELAACVDLAATLGLHLLPGRCAHGYAQVQHPRFCECTAVPAAKRDGIARANRNADDDMKERIDRAIAWHAKSGKPFSANDMRVALEGISGPVVGGRFTAANNAGLIKFTGERVPSNLKSTHGHEVKVWIGARAA